MSKCYFINLTEVLGEECIPRSYDFDSMVCVCNATYCDNIPQVRPPLKGNYVWYVSSKDGLRFQRSVGSFKSTQVPRGKSVKIHFRVKILSCSRSHTAVV